MILTLTRSIYGPAATLGLLTVAGVTYHTIEQPWRDDAAFSSCVPDGTYMLMPYESPKHGDTWCLHNPAYGIYGTAPPVGARGYCELHAGNWASQLEGCIAPGLSAGTMIDPSLGTEQPAVLDSQEAIRAILAALGPMSTGHTLIIQPASGIIGTGD